MTYAMLYAENAEILGTYESFESAADDLARYVNEHSSDQPGLEAEIGLCKYVDGRPVGNFMPAREIAKRHGRFEREGGEVPAEPPEIAERTVPVGDGIPYGN